MKYKLAIFVICSAVFLFLSSCQTKQEKEFYEKIKHADYDVIFYLCGKNVKKCDYLKDMKRIENDAESGEGLGEAEYVSALMSYYGIGGNRDIDKYFNLLFKCAKKQAAHYTTHPSYCNDELFERFQEDISNKESDYLKYAFMVAEEKDLPEVQYALAQYYRYGLGVKQDYKEYIKIITSIADNEKNTDYEEALGEAVEIYKYGLGDTKKNYIKSFEYSMQKEKSGLDLETDEGLEYSSKIFYERMTSLINEILGNAKKTLDKKNRNECSSDKYDEDMEFRRQCDDENYALSLVEKDIFKQYVKDSINDDEAEFWDDAFSFETVFEIFLDFAVQGNEAASYFFEQAAKTDKILILNSLEERRERYMNKDDIKGHIESCKYSEEHWGVVPFDCTNPDMPKYKKNLENIIAKIKKQKK